MTIPDYQRLMTPLLELTSDGAEHKLSDAVEDLATTFQLTEQERHELLPSGRQPVLDNRVGWARTYMAKAGLLRSSGRGRFRITERGLDALRGQSSAINTKFLTNYPEFLAFQGSKVPYPTTPPSVAAELQTPEERLESAYQSLRLEMTQDLLVRAKGCSPGFFERLVVDLLLSMGYGGSRRDAGQAIGQSGDGGIDGIIKEDRLGLDVVCVQAKRWEGVVGRPVVQAFAGSLEGSKARKGVLITTSHFSQEANDYVRSIEKRIVLIDGAQLAEFMLDHGIGTTDIARYDIKRVDLDYFDES